MQHHDVVIVGGGIVGLGIAWQVQCSGRSVLVVDPDPASGATFAAAGMLAPVTEFHHQERPLQSLMLAAAELWPQFAAGLAANIGYRKTGTVLVGVDAADRAALSDLVAAQSLAGLPVDRLSLAELRRQEPLLAAHVGPFGYFASGDHQVDPRKLAQAVIERLDIRRAAAVAVAPGMVQLTDGNQLFADEVIVANGLAAGTLLGLPVPLPLRPVHGDILRLGVPPALRPLLTHTVRGLVHGSAVYLVPRADGTLVIGATQREDQQRGISAGGVYQLLRDAQALVPAVAELELLEFTARARPGTPDNSPLLGRVSAGLIVATGMFRHGVLLTPAIAKICLEILAGAPDPQWDQFAATRFSTQGLSAKEPR